MERGHWVRDPEPEEVEEWAVEQEAVGALEEVEAKEGWEETAPEQDLRETACVPPVVPRSYIQQGHHAIR
jgi:hypothetical protein